MTWWSDGTRRCATPEIFRRPIWQPLWNTFGGATAIRFWSFENCLLTSTFNDSLIRQTYKIGSVGMCTCITSWICKLNEVIVNKSVTVRKRHLAWTLKLWSHFENWSISAEHGSFKRYDEKKQSDYSEYKGFERELAMAAEVFSQVEWSWILEHREHFSHGESPVTNRPGHFKGPMFNTSCKDLFKRINACSSRVCTLLPAYTLEMDVHYPRWWTSLLYFFHPT